MAISIKTVFFTIITFVIILFGETNNLYSQQHYIGVGVTYSNSYYADKSIKLVNPFRKDPYFRSSQSFYVQYNYEIIVDKRTSIVPSLAIGRLGTSIGYDPFEVMNIKFYSVFMSAFFEFKPNKFLKIGVAPEVYIVYEGKIAFRGNDQQYYQLKGAYLKDFQRTVLGANSRITTSVTPTFSLYLNYRLDLSSIGSLDWNYSLKHYNYSVGFGILMNLSKLKSYKDD